MIPKYPVWQDIPTYVAIGLLFVAALYVYFKTKRNWTLIIIGGFLITATNLLSGGVNEGLRYPIIGSGIQEATYWQESLKITNPTSFISSFTLVQPYLKVHGRIHPPGAILIVFLFRQIYDNPLFVSTVILAIFLLSSYLFKQYVATQFDSDHSRLLLFLLLLLPAVQIYTWSTIDALVVSGFVTVIWAWNSSHSYKFLITMTAFWLTSFITYATVILIPILFLSEWQTTKQIKQTLILIASIIGIYLLLNILFGYSYLQSFQFAKAVETQLGANPGYTPLSYVFTRLENILEIIVFLGPYLTYLLYQGFKNLWSLRNINHPGLIAGLGILSLLGVFILGGYYTGETARGAIYLYPCVLLIISIYISKIKPGKPEQLLLLSLVFLQTVLMQSFGWFSW